jgi:hypothetical protein
MPNTERNWVKTPLTVPLLEPKPRFSPVWPGCTAATGKDGRGGGGLAIGTAVGAGGGPEGGRGGDGRGCILQGGYPSGPLGVPTMAFRRLSVGVSGVFAARRAIKTLATSVMRPSRIAVDYDVLAGNYLALQSAAGPGVTVVPTVGGLAISVFLRVLRIIEGVDVFYGYASLD